ncbi:MAG: ComEC/Rec2 family competence protein [Raoultibacter sp.]
MGACGVACLLGAVVGCVALWFTRHKAFACLMLGLCLGGVCAAVASLDYAADVGAALEEASGVHEFMVVEDAVKGDFGLSCCAETTLTGGRRVKVRINFNQEENREVAAEGSAAKTTSNSKGEQVASDRALYRYGQRFRTYTTLRKPSLTAEHSYYRQGIAARATAFTLEAVPPSGAFGALLDFREAALASFASYEGEGAAFLRAVLFGERSGLEEGGFYTAVKTCGLAHIIAVSGAHLVVVSSFIGLFLRVARVNRFVSIGAQVAFIGCYLVFTGLPISAIRAAVMSLITLMSLFASRRSSGISALSLCACVLLSVDPSIAFSLSFALSAAATLGIVVFGGLMGDWCKGCLPVRQGFVRDSLAMTLSSNLFTLPIAAAVFAQISLIAPLANVIALPLFTLFCGGGLAAVILFLLIPPLGSFLVGCLVVAAQAFCEGVVLLARVPFAALPFSGDIAVLVLLAGVIAVVLWIWWPQPTRLVCVGACVIALALGGLVVVVMPRFAPDEIVMLDVGQGDAFLVRSQGATLLVDTGNQDAALLRGLAHVGVYHLDAVLITHPDSDHCDSLRALHSLVATDRVLVADGVLSCSCNACVRLREAATQVVGVGGVQGVTVGDTLRVGSFIARVVWPIAFSDEGGNADSVCLALDDDIHADGMVEWRALLCGDAEQPQIAEMIARKEVGDIDIYKVGHHGSKHALGATEAKVLDPEIALFSVGSNNRYGHPAAETIAVLEAQGATAFRSDEQGEVVCRLLADRIEVETLR